MNEPFILTVNDQEYKARFERWGYTHRFAVLIDETTVTFEPDEEGGYRAISEQPVKASLLQAISEKLSKLS